MKLENRVNKEELKQALLASNEPRTTLSFYQYAKIGNPTIFRHHVYLMWKELGVYGRIYVAGEGVNGQLSVPTPQFEAFKASMDSITFLKDIRLNIAIEDDGKSFYKLTIKVRDKIVADGLLDESFDVTDRGVHLNAASFNEIAAEEDTIIVDMRNHYESEVGHFENAIRPEVDTFRESLPIVADQLSEHRDKKIVMYCTGGIRCEKASAYMKHHGFEKVYQLDGGIIEYTRQVSQQGLKNKFIGKNFVFDERMGERISEDVISKCHQCGTVCDDHVNCEHNACHLLFIQCPSCAAKYEGCCSVKCRDFNKLPADDKLKYGMKISFNGSTFSKSRYSTKKGRLNAEEALPSLD